jgi:hypothetical protein
MLVDSLEAALDLGQHLDALEVVWLIGGSVASSLLGEPRATADVDLVADLRLRHVGPLYARLAESYYVDEDTVRWAVKERRTFNVIHFASMVKVDVYCSEDNELARRQLARRWFVPIGERRVPCTPRKTSSFAS